ncbi:MAG: DUF393 domain-containing protein [Gemmatimonadota bacterium]|nr:DUF393 domain-containing protein [Gemmatimonadota bacterium]
MNGARTAPRYAVVYDGNCGVCLRFVARLEHWDPNNDLEIVPSQHADVAARFGWIPPRELEQSVQVVRLSDSKTWQGASAIEELLKILPHGALASWIFRLPFARPFAEKMYRVFARNRFRYGCAEHCRTT